MESSNVEKVIGVRVSTEEYFGPLKFEQREVPPETLAEMIRHRLEPILDIEEVQKRGRDFILVSDFAVKSKRG